jgi:iron complex transport system permease protein
MYGVSSGLVVGAILLALFTSSVTVPIVHILEIIWHRLGGAGSVAHIPENIQMIIWDIRLPRVLLAFCVGAALALSGAAFQGLLRNPLADPYTIGVSSGAGLGAVAVIFFGLTWLGSFTLPLLGIAGGFVTLMIVFGMTRLSGRGLAVETIILAGIIVSSFIGAFISLIIALSGEDMMQIV